MKLSQSLTWTGWLAGLCVLTSCASVKVRKVPTPTQYALWTDRMQRKADSLEGFRFYLPRPFVNVFESFPVRTDIYIADGHVTPDGKYVIVESVRTESGLNEYLAGIKKDTLIPSQAIFPPSAAAKDAAGKALNAQSGFLEAMAKAATNVAGTKVTTGGTDTGQPTGTTPPSTTPAATTGINQRDVRNDNGAFAYQPMRGNMDIAYLPDFEEQYAVSSKSGLGNAKFSMNLGQGWSLQSFNSLTDNSELNKRIFDVIDESIRLAKAAAMAATGVPPVDVAGTTKLLTSALGAQSGPAEGGAQLTAGAPVSLKIVVVHYAAKGLYPVIKPRELQERRAKDGSYYLWYDLFSVIPRATPGTAFDPTALERAQAAVANESGRFTVPRYPYQYLSFNTFRYLIVELIRPDTKPFEYLYDKVGTTGSPGDRQAVDLGEAIRAGVLANATKKASDNSPEKFSNFALEGMRGQLLNLGKDNTDTLKITSAEQQDGAEVSIHVGAGPGIPTRPYFMKEVIGAIKMLPQVAKASTGLQGQVNEKNVIIDDSAKDRVSPSTAESPAAAGDAAEVEKLARGARIGSGGQSADYFSFSDPTFKDGTLNATPRANGNVEARFTAKELGEALGKDINQKINRDSEVVKRVELNGQAVSDLEKQGKLNKE